MARRKAQQRSQLPLFLILAGVVLILGVLIYAAVSGRGNTGGAATGGDVPYATIQRVTLADAKGAYDQKTAVFLDVRDADSYKAGHIPGAINIPLANLESRLNELNRDQWIITYCTWPAEESSARAAATMANFGFKKVNPILGGFAAWRNAGYPVE